MCTSCISGVGCEDLVTDPPLSACVTTEGITAA